MCRLTFTDDLYHSPPKRIPWLTRRFPALVAYTRFCGIVWSASRKAKHGKYSDQEWCKSSLAIVRALEDVGIEFDISGISHIEKLDTPCVVVANHMSTLETGALPCLIQPIRDVTFVVKKGLLT